MKSIDLFCTGLALALLACSFCAIAFGQDSAFPEAKARVENATNSLAEKLVSSDMTNLTEIYGLLEDQLRDNPDIYGAAFAFAPAQRDGRQVLAAPYVYRDEEEIKQKDLSESYRAEGYNYLESQWYSRPASLGQPKWSDPYYDDGGAGENILMITYSVPLFTKDEAHRLIGVLTGDLLIEKGPQ